MNFRTQIPISKSNTPIDYNSKIVSLGSCFAVNMAEKFNYFKFQNTCNPFGILFHPLAIEKMIAFAVSEKQFSSEDVFFHNERWNSFNIHSDLSNSNKEELIENLNFVNKSIRRKLSDATQIIITYGTSWVYRNIESNAIVANCHKVQQKQFVKELLSIGTILASIKNTIDLIREINPKANIIFTVSPVRHIKDGFVENQRSKAHLITAIQQILDFKSEIINYFPSYEIMMDELRDYRFYSEDMLHPSQFAIDYIWERFFQTQISDEIYSDMEQISSIQKALQHRPFNPNSESHLKFEEKLAEKITKLVSQYSFMKF
ncbi:MAG: GSCFA domain-containing protein [Bacteroidota bacterium]